VNELPIQTGFPAQTGGQQPGTLDVREVYDFFLRRWKFIVSTAGLLCLLTLVIVFSLTPRYTGTAQVLLDPDKDNALGANGLISELTLDSASVDSQVALIQSRSLLQRVVTKENLVEDPEFGTAPSGLSGWLFGWWRNSDEKPPADGASPAVIKTVQNLSDSLEVSRDGRTYVLNISVTSKNAEKAARLANAAADAYIVDQLEARYDAAKRASIWLSDRLQTLRGELKKSEETVETFRSQNNLVATTTGTINEQQLSELNATLVAVRAEAAEHLAKWQQAEKLVDSGGQLDSIPDVIKSPVVADLRKQEAEVSGREADLVAKYGDRHPLIVNIRAERADIERQIDAEVRRIIANLKNDHEVTHSRELSLEKSLRDLTGETGLDNETAIRLRELERVAEADRTLYEQFLSRAKIADAEKTFQPKNARIISEATTPESPSFPKKKLILALAAVMGLGLGTGGAFLLELLNSGFTSPKQIEEQLNLPVLASIALLKEEDRQLNGQSLPVPQLCLAKPLSAFSESIRTLRTGIKLSDIDHPAQIVMVTSAMPGEGKTTIATSLALSAASSGISTLLIDSDLRKPALSKSFGLVKIPGLVEFLAGTTPLQEIIRKDKSSGLFIVGVGSTTAQSPPDLLGSHKMQELIAALREVYDFIIFDTPPLGPVIDSAVISGLVDKVVLVTRWGETPREMVMSCLQKIANQRKTAGVAFNMIDESQASRYGRYSYYGQKYYGKYYTQ
jgi:succinoglycan biosynthesis transport protein ExoP